MSGALHPSADEAIVSKEPKIAASNSGNSTDDIEGTNVAAGIINEKSLLRKIDLKLLPAVGILYLLSFLDRSNGKILHGRKAVSAESRMLVH